MANDGQDLGGISGSREPNPQAVSALSGFDPGRLAAALTPEMLYDLRNVAEGKPTVPGFGNPVWHLKCLGYVEKRTITKPCRSCGKPEVDYRYNKITEAGRAVLAASGTEARSGGTACGSDPKDDGPARDSGDAHKGV